MLPTIGAIELPNITSYEAGAISPSRGLKSLAVNPEATLVPGGGTSILSSNEGGPSLVYVSGSADLVKQYEQTVKDNIGKSNEANKDNPDYKPLFMVTFLDEKGGTQVTEQVAKGEKLGDDQQPQDVKEQPGFEFAGWLDESDPENWWAFDKTFDKDVKYTARWIDLAPVREAAAKAVDEALASYKESDYTAEGWAALTKAAADAKAAVNAAGSTADVEAAKAAGIKDMADIAANPANRPAKPVDPDKPTDPDKPVDPSGPTGPDTPSGPTDPAGPSDPVDPSEPSDPSNPAGPGEPSGPADPAQPASSGEPTSGAPAASDDAAKKPVALAKTGDVLPLAAGALALAALASTAFAFVARKRSAR